MIHNQEKVLDAAHQALAQGRSLVFDLDNTLYPEIDYLSQAYQAFARQLAPEYGFDPEQAAGFLLEGLRQGRRSTLLQDFQMACQPQLRAQKTPDPERCRETLFWCLREKTPDRELVAFPWAEELFADPQRRASFALITNGNPRQQKNKVRHLPLLSGIAPEQIVFANLYAPKPAIDAALKLAEVMELRDPVYFGDSDSDRVFAQQAGFFFVHVDYRFDEQN